jgi:hypothetical protein
VTVFFEDDFHMSNIPSIHWQENQLDFKYHCKNSSETGPCKLRSAHIALKNGCQYCKGPKSSSIAEKGHNEILEIVNPLAHMTALTKAAEDHVSENGGT